MKRIGFVGLVVATGIVPCLEMTARPVLASCQTPCAVQLCAGTAPGTETGTAGAMPSIVTATYDAAVPGVLTVETVLREGSSGPILQPGDPIAATEPISGSHFLVYASTPPAWFPIGNDGFVRCAFVDSSQLPAPGHGATPQTIATLAGTSTCEDQLSRSGYPIPACNDILSPPSSGCQIGAGPSPGHARLGGLVVVALGGALATLAVTGSRRRRGQKRKSDGGGVRE